MKKIIVTAFISSIAFHLSASAEQIKVSPRFEELFKIISKKTLINSQTENLLLELNGNCQPSSKTQKEKYKSGNMECDPESGVVRLEIEERNGNGVGTLEADISGKGKCEYLVKILKENFGKPTRVAAPCTMTWKLKPSKIGTGVRTIILEESSVKDVVYFIQVEDMTP